MRSSDLYQIFLILLGAAAVAMFGFFLYWELFPEYKVFQKDYVSLERFRSEYTGESPPAFEYGVKQILLVREDKGPPLIDRCTSCHLALQIDDFSPTAIAHDINGNIIRDEEGNPIQVANEKYIWGRIDKKIAELKDAKVLSQLRDQGNTSEISSRLDQAKELEQLKTVQIDGHTYSVVKALSAHPLIGKETRPFEFHPLEEYGCTSCHNGNGSGLTVNKAHGPVFDEQYEVEDMGPTPQFLESDPNNDPQFSREFNNKPADNLLFQTTPIFVGTLIQSKCIQCHQTSPQALREALNSTSIVTDRRQKRSNAIKESFENEEKALISLLQLKTYLEKSGLEATHTALKIVSENYSLPSSERLQAVSQLEFLNSESNKKLTKEQILKIFSEKIQKMIGSVNLTAQLDQLIAGMDQAEIQNLAPAINHFLVQHIKDPGATGSLFTKYAALNLEEEMLRHVADTEHSLKKASEDTQFLTSVSSDLDQMLKGYHQGEELYVSQACYACHRIATFTRGGVGPELTREGINYPWFIKQSIVWPQADLATSTMPNMRLDHEELEKLTTFLLGQTGEDKAVSDTSYKLAVQEWEAGKKLPWEEPITPSQILDLRYSMSIFATQGCAACHRLKGFDSNVGFAVEKDNKTDFAVLHNEQEWFSSLFPEDILGSLIVEAIDQHHEEIDKRLVDNVRTGSLLEEIDKASSGKIEAFYSNFKYAMRAKNDQFAKNLAAASTQELKDKIQAEHNQWQARIKKILMVYIQEYGLGRLIGPRPNWSGVYRTDEWLMEHFHNPGSHVPNSIMPVFPFDNTKFYALTHMLDVLGIRNRNAVRDVWQHNGFDPALAASTFCSQCHGELLIGNGAVAQWIYPIPKNLRNPDFLRNLTKEQVIHSITHGVKGTPMPPWGEVANDKLTADGIPVLTKAEIEILANWLFSSVPGAEVIKTSQDVPKWQYGPKDIIEDLKKEGNQLKSDKSDDQKMAHELSKLFPKSECYYASLTSVVSRKQENLPDNEVSEIFDVKANPASPDQYDYYIKRSYYTENNIASGKRFFELNCAICHGNEADGTGARAEIMRDAKPRMLTNLDWINTHDDLYLLRSIKYGVPGTSMVAWGDDTSGLQRLQLVMFIRSLSEEEDARAKFTQLLYKLFEVPQFDIERARVHEYAAIDKLQNEYTRQQNMLSRMDNMVKEGKGAAEDAAKLYQESLQTLVRLQKRKSIDQLFLELKGAVRQEEEAYKQLGFSMQSQKVDETIFDKYMQILMLNADRYKLDSHLILTVEPSNEQKIAALETELKKLLDQQVIKKQKEIDAEQEKFSSSEESDTLSHLNGELKSLIKLRNDSIANLSKASRLRQKQTELWRKLQAQEKIDKDNAKT